MKLVLILSILLSSFQSIFTEANTNNFDCGRLNPLVSDSAFPLTGAEQEALDDAQYFNDVDQVKTCEIVSDEAPSKTRDSGSQNSGSQNNSSQSSASQNTAAQKSASHSNASGSTASVLNRQKNNAFSSAFQSNESATTEKSISNSSHEVLPSNVAIKKEGTVGAAVPENHKLLNGKKHEKLKAVNNKEILRKQLKEKAEKEKDPTKKKEIEALLNSL